MTLGWDLVGDVQGGAVSQLSRVIDVLDHAELRYWIDAGSLLGLVRDGALLPWDKDIDLGCWSEELPAVGRAVEGLRGQGYHIAIRSYRGDVYQVRARPPIRALRSGSRWIDIAVFRRRGDTAWCPINCVQPQPAPRFSPRWFVQKPLREAVIRRWVRQEDRGPMSVRWPRLELDVRTWIMPAHHFLDLEHAEIEGTTVDVPADAEQYLALRYGAWREPRQTWNYCEDDGAIDRRPPDAVGALR